jgi:hypothetical protein
VAAVPVNVASQGTLSVVVDWTFAANVVEAYVTRGGCTADAFRDGRCEVLGASTNPNAKPKRMVIAPAPAGTYTLVVRNLGPGDESFAYDLTLSR